VSEEQQNGHEDLGHLRAARRFHRQANVKDPSVYEKAKQDFESFWVECARDLHWFKEWDQVLKWDPPNVEWFAGGKTNVATTA
jgi:acetyl-CoA synthetase